jgi:ATP-dependent DNA ligase
VCDENGLAVFELIRQRGGALASAMHRAFDLLELDGKDLRREPIEKRKELHAELLAGSQLCIVFNECFEEDGEAVFREACKLGCEGIVSKRGWNPQVWWASPGSPAAIAPRPALAEPSQWPSAARPRRAVRRACSP